MPPVLDEMVPCSCQASQGKPSLNIEVWQTFRNNEIFLELVIFSSDIYSDTPSRRNAKIRFPGHHLKYLWWICVGKDRKFGTLEKIQTHCSWPHFLPHSLFLCNRWSVFRSRKCFVRERERAVSEVLQLVHPTKLEITHKWKWLERKLYRHSLFLNSLFIYERLTSNLYFW